MMKSSIFKPLLRCLMSVRDGQVWKSGYVHLTGTILARYTPGVVIAVPETKEPRMYS